MQYIDKGRIEAAQKRAVGTAKDELLAQVHEEVFIAIERLVQRWFNGAAFSPLCAGTNPLWMPLPRFGIILYDQEADTVKTTMGIFVWLVCHAIYGQSLPERQQGLRVALAITASPNADSKATKTSGELRTVLTRELEKLGDVRVTSLSETYDERLEVIVAGGG